MHGTVNGEIPKSVRDKIICSLLGVANGDALGAPFESAPPGHPIRALADFGGRILTFHGGGEAPRGAWTDDTCLTLAACRGFVNAHSKKSEKPLEAALAEALRAASTDPGFRKPGKTVWHAVKTGHPDGEAWGTGALMRIAPAAFYAALCEASVEEAAHVALYLARLTHGHPLAVFPAVECALAILSLLRGEDRVPEYLDDLSFIDGFTREHLRYAEYAAVRHAPLNEIPSNSGLWMWRFVLERILNKKPGSPWFYLPSFREGVLKAVNESWDRDTAGAVAGAILGAHSGTPYEWDFQLERYEEIVSLAKEMSAVVRRDEEELKRIQAANSLDVQTHYVKLKRGRAEEILGGHVGALLESMKAEVLENRLGFGIVVHEVNNKHVGKIVVMKSPELITDFHWPVHNPCLPWEKWTPIADTLEEWKLFSAEGLNPGPYKLQSRSDLNGTVEVTCWAKTEESLPTFCLVDGRCGPPRGRQVCCLETGPNERALHSVVSLRREFLRQLENPPSAGEDGPELVFSHTRDEGPWSIDRTDKVYFWKGKYFVLATMPIEWLEQHDVGYCEILSFDPEEDRYISELDREELYDNPCLGPFETILDAFCAHPRLIEVWASTVRISCSLMKAHELAVRLWQLIHGDFADDFTFFINDEPYIYNRQRCRFERKRDDTESDREGPGWDGWGDVTAEEYTRIEELSEKPNLGSLSETIVSMAQHMSPGAQIQLALLLLREDGDDAAALQILKPIMTGPDPDWRDAALKAFRNNFSNLKKVTCIPEIVDLLKSWIPAVAREAAYVLGMIGDASVIPALKEANKLHGDEVLWIARMTLEGKSTEVCSRFGYTKWHLYPYYQLCNRARALAQAQNPLEETAVGGDDLSDAKPIRLH